MYHIEAVKHSRPRRRSSGVRLVPRSDELSARLRSIIHDIAPPTWTARHRDVATPERLAMTMRPCQKLADDLRIPAGDGLHSAIIQAVKPAMPTSR